jgi:hypothetical protein
MMDFLAFAGWLAETEWSIGLHESQYAYSILESVHVWTMAFFFGLVAMFDLRLLGWIMRSVPVSDVVDRLRPWTIGAFVVMVITGLLLFYAIPVRSYQNIFFRFKMVLLVLAGLNIFLFHSRIHPKIEAMTKNGVPPQAARVAGAISLVLWIGIVFSGRMIAYNWFDCDRQPQTALVNFLTSCDPDVTGQ